MPGSLRDVALLIFLLDRWCISALCNQILRVGTEP